MKKKEGATDMTSSNILIWNEKVGFIKINEGSGDNLFDEDEGRFHTDMHLTNEELSLF